MIKKYFIIHIPTGFVARFISNGTIRYFWFKITAKRWLKKYLTINSESSIEEYEITKGK